MVRPIDSLLHWENSLRLPLVALANMMKFPSAPPGEQGPGGSCYIYIYNYTTYTQNRHDFYSILCMLTCPQLTYR